MGEISDMTTALRMRQICKIRSQYEETARIWASFKCVTLYKILYYVLSPPFRLNFRISTLKDLHQDTDVSWILVNLRSEH
jgi:hypothetical protein